LDPLDGVNVYDMHTLLAADALVATDGDPRPLCPHMRDVLSTWYAYVWAHGLDGDPDLKRDQIFNMVDLTKSYVAATRRGLVMDFKIGPSPHLADYAAEFAEKFISFRRGSLMGPGLPENQCLGTMQDANTIRCLYAGYFNGKVQNDVGNLKTKPKNKFYDFFTSTHANFFAFIKYRKHTLNVTLQAPNGAAIGSRYKFHEFEGAQNQGPFRVFKKAGDQTNQSSGEKTTPAEVRALAQYVWLVEIPKYYVPGGGRYRDGAEDALHALPDK
jgi:hypothetical protein